MQLYRAVHEGNNSGHTLDHGAFRIISMKLAMMCMQYFLISKATLISSHGISLTRFFLSFLSLFTPSTFNPFTLCHEVNL